MADVDRTDIFSKSSAAHGSQTDVFGHPLLPQKTDNFTNDTNAKRLLRWRPVIALF